MLTFGASLPPPSWKAITSSKLALVSGDLVFSNSLVSLFTNSLQVVSFTSLTVVTGNLLIDGGLSTSTSAVNMALTYVNFPALTLVQGNLAIANQLSSNILNNIVLTALAAVQGNFDLNNNFNGADGTLDLSALTYIGGYFSIQSNTDLASPLFGSTEIYVNAGNVIGSSFVLLCNNNFDSKVLPGHLLQYNNIACMYDYSSCAATCSQCLT